MGKLHVKGWGYLNGKVACQGVGVSQKHTAKVTPESVMKLTPESGLKLTPESGFLHYSWQIYDCCYLLLLI